MLKKNCKVEDTPPVIHFLMKSQSLEENNINKPKIIVLGCTKKRVPFVKQSRVGGLLGQPVRPLQSISTRCLTSPARLKSLTWHGAQK